jgi:hypothetical protein
MSIQYVHLKPDEPTPSLGSAPFCALIVSEAAAGDAWRERVTEWLVESGCLYAVAWGLDCEAWHDSVDEANLREFDYGDIPDDQFVMTTWHSNEPLSEAFWFAGQCASHPTVELNRIIIVHVSDEPRKEEMLQTFDESQTLRADD